ncbi:histone-lysine N-methyltransferase EZ3 isoform X2 [Daucus carota subsp. sativus]
MERDVQTLDSWNWEISWTWWQPITLSCSKSCKNRFRGCCCAKNQSRTRQCSCVAANRKCDSDVCLNCFVSCGDGTCGAPPPKEKSYNCMNMKLFQNQHQKVLIGESSAHS